MRLGVSQTRYVFLDQASSHDRLQKMIDGFAALRFRFPSNMRTSDDLAAFCTAVSQVVDLVVGADSTLARGYCCLKFFTLQQRLLGPCMWDSADMAKLAGFLPDENKYLDKFQGMTAQAVRMRFGMSPVSVAATACFWGTVPEWKLTRLRAKSVKDILSAVSSPPAEPMASLVREARDRGEALTYIVSPNVWVAELVQDSS